MYLPEKILIALAFTASVHAAVLNTRGSTKFQRRDVQSCHCHNHGVSNSYSVWIGVPYDVNDCDNTYSKLEYLGGVSPFDGCAISNWQCVEAGDGNTQLWFNAVNGEADCINLALHESYPTVNEFNCPDD